MDEVLGLLVQLVRYVRGEVEAYELASRGHSEEVRRDFVDAPVALWELGNRPVLPQPLTLVRDERDVVVVKLVGNVPKERRGDSGVLKRDNPLLVNYLLNLGSVGLERLKVSVLGENLYPVIAISASSVPSTLRVQFVHPVNG